MCVFVHIRYLRPVDKINYLHVYSISMPCQQNELLVRVFDKHALSKNELLVRVFDKYAMSTK